MNFLHQWTFFHENIISFWIKYAGELEPNCLRIFSNFLRKLVLFNLWLHLTSLKCKTHLFLDSIDWPSTFGKRPQCTVFSRKLCSEPVRNRPHSLLNQRSCPFWEKSFQNIRIATEKMQNCNWLLQNIWRIFEDVKSNTGQLLFSSPNQYFHFYWNWRAF